MKKSEVKQLLELDDKFQTRCSEICDLLKPSRPYMYYMDTFTIGDEYVECEGDEYWSYGGHEHYAGKFPTKYLWMSNKEIKSIVDEELKKQAEEQAEKRQKLIDEEYEREKAEYERLKKKYEEAYE